MLTRLKKEFANHNIDITNIPITMDSWYVSEPLKQKLYQLGCSKIVVVGKGNYVFKGDEFNGSASQWKQRVEYENNSWGIDVPAQRKTLFNKTFGQVNLWFFRKSSTRSFYLIDFSTISLRSVEMWRIWKGHNLIEQFWKIWKSVLGMGSMRLRGDGLYMGLLIKAIAY